MPRLRYKEHTSEPPWGFHETDLENEYRLEDGLCENDAEVEARIIEAKQAGVDRPLITCGWCGSSRQFRTTQISGAIDWFRSHSCGASTEATTLAQAPERVPQPLAA